MSSINNKRVTTKEILKTGGQGGDFDLRELEDEMARVVSKIIYDSSPFYASVLMQCARVYTFKIPTLAVAVTQQVLLIINPDFFMGRAKAMKNGKEILIGCSNTAERLGVIEHELLHLIFYHISRGSRYRDHETGNVAADLVCNQFVRFKLPSGALKIDQYGFPADKDMDFYYNAIKDGKGQQKGQGKQAGPGQKGQSQPGSTPGQGSPGPGQPGDGEGEGGFATAENGRGSHDTWRDSGEDVPPDQQTEKVLEDMGIEGGAVSDKAREAIVCDVLSQAASLAGREGMSKLPGAVAGQVEEMIKPKQATQPWNVILRRFMGTHGSSMLKQSRKYSSRRYRDPITGRKARPGLRVKRQKKILVGIDTSGSMSTSDLELLAGEIGLIWRYNKDITVVECDTQINRKYAFRGEIKSVCGRGGTDLNEIRQLFEEGEYDCCICMTDGYVGSIGERAPRKGWLWVVTHGGMEPAPWGSYVHLPDSTLLK